MLRAVPNPAPGNLGLLPLAVPIAIGIASLVAGAIGIAATAQEIQKGAEPKPPNLPPPAPAAPQTREELETWTPDILWARQREAWSKWVKAAVPAPPGEKPKNGMSPWLIGALAIGGISGLVVMFRR